MVIVGGDTQWETSAEACRLNGTTEEPIPKEIDTRNWVPDNLIVEACRLNSGATTMYYTCHMLMLVFKLGAEFMKRVIKGRETCMDKSTLQGKYNWIPEGWAMEIRAGWEGKNKKMFKLFVHKSSGVRFSSKENVSVFEEIVQGTKLPATRLSFEDVLLFEELVKERKVSRGTVDTECDTHSQDNMLAQVDFYTSRLSAGWIKETIYRKCSQGVKKDLYFTDPVSHLVFRTKKSAEQYFWTKGNLKDGCSPTLSVRDKYFCDKCKDMPDERYWDRQYEAAEENPN
uniref:Uncharacterized protein n=1 Tax=Avena sativa TaxID=4498 RepID=A0ACD5WLR6_AVESA